MDRTYRKTKRFPYLDEDIKTEVLIIGGGITGASLAYHFTKYGVDTVLIDGQKFGFGNTLSDPGIIVTAPDITVNRLKNILDDPYFPYCFYQNVKQEVSILGNAGTNDSGFLNKDHLCYSDTIAGTNDLTLEYIFRREHDFPCELLNSLEGLSLKTGIYQQRGGGIANPFQWTHQLLDKSLQNGLRAFENTRAVQLQCTPNGYLTKTGYHNLIASKIIICATGTETALFTDRKFGVPSYRLQLLSEPIEGLPSMLQNTIFQNIRCGFTFYATGDSRILIEGETNTKNSKAKEAQLKQTLTELLGRTVGIAQRTTHRTVQTRDRLPIIGVEPVNPCMLYALPYGANPLLSALYAGDALCRFYRGQYPAEFKHFKPERTTL